MDHQHHMHLIAEWGGWVLAVALGLGLMVRERSQAPPTDAIATVSAVVPAPKFNAANREHDPFYSQKVAAPVDAMPDPF